MRWSTLGRRQATEEATPKIQRSKSPRLSPLKSSTDTREWQAITAAYCLTSQIAPAASKLAAQSRISTTLSRTMPSPSNCSKIGVWRRYIGRTRKSKTRWAWQCLLMTGNSPLERRAVTTSLIRLTSNRHTNYRMRALASCRPVRSGFAKTRSSTSQATRSLPISPSTKRPSSSRLQVGSKELL